MNLMGNKMRVVILGENGSVHVQKWVKAINEYKEIELHVITFDRGVKYEGVTYHFLKIFFNNKLDFFLNSGIVNRFIERIKPDIVHAHYATSYGYLGANTGFHPFVITGWGADIFDSPKNFVMKKLLQRTFNKADAITVLSNITRIEMKKLTSKQVELIPFGVDIEKFKKRVFHKDDGIIRIGTIRTLSEKYGIEFLIRAFALLSKKHANLRLEIIGDGPLRNQLEALAAELKVKDIITFHGYVNQNTDFETYIQFLSRLDIFTILSILDSETFGVAAVEASACSLPVVATNVGGLPEVIENEKTGILVKPKHVEETAEALEKLIVNAELRAKMGKQGRLKVEAEYYWKNNVKKMVDLYYRVSLFNKQL